MGNNGVSNAMAEDSDQEAFEDGGEAVEMLDDASAPRRTCPGTLFQYLSIPATTMSINTMLILRKEVRKEGKSTGKQLKQEWAQALTCGPSTLEDFKALGGQFIR